MEIVNSIRAMNAANQRRAKNQRLFEDRVRDNQSDDQTIQFDHRVTASALNSAFVDIDIHVRDDQDETQDALVYLTALKTYVTQLIRDKWGGARNGGISFTLETVIKFYALNDPTVTSVYTMTSEYYAVFTAGDIIPSVDAACEDIIQEIENYQNGRSSWVIDDIIRSSLKYQNFQPSRSVKGGGLCGYDSADQQEAFYLSK